MAIPDQAVWKQAVLPALSRLRGSENSSTKTDVEFIYTSSPNWPLRSCRVSSMTVERLHKPIRISILDSSFNPPTKTHLELASSSPPPLTSEQGAYDAHMLLLSVTNADKRLKPGDATYSQRLEMMVLIAEEMEESHKGKMNVCVAAIDEPTFVGKSIKLRRAIAHQIASLSTRELQRTHEPSDIESETRASDSPGVWNPEIHLYFILGFDTVIRLFDPHYYESKETMRASLRSFFAPVSEGGDDSYVLCARRSNPTKAEDENKAVPDQDAEGQENSEGPTSGMSKEESDFFSSPEVRDYWESGKVSMVEDLDLELQGISSTLARKASAIAEGQDAELRRLLPSSILDYVHENRLYLDI